MTKPRELSRDNGDAMPDFLDSLGQLVGSCRINGSNLARNDQQTTLSTSNQDTTSPCYLSPSGRHPTRWLIPEATSHSATFLPAPSRWTDCLASTSLPVWHIGPSFLRSCVQILIFGLWSCPLPTQVDPAWNLCATPTTVSGSGRLASSVEALPARQTAGYPRGSSLSASRATGRVR